MKRIWVSAIILVSLTVLCGLGIFTTSRLTSQMTQTLSSAKEAAESGNQEEAERLSEKASQDWITAHAILCTFIPHSRLEAIDQTLAGLAPLIAHGTIDQFSSECSRGIRQVECLNEAEMPTLGNIL